MSVGLLKRFLLFGDIGALFVQRLLASIQLPLGLLLQKVEPGLQSLLLVQQSIKYFGAGLVAVLRKKEKKLGRQYRSMLTVPGTVVRNPGDCG